MVKRLLCTTAFFILLSTCILGLLTQGHLTTVFCKISEFGEANIAKKIPVDDRFIHVQFSKLIFNKFPTINFLKLNFSHFSPQVWLFFVSQRKP